MIERLNKKYGSDYVKAILGILVILLMVGGYSGFKAIQNNQKAATCEASGGTSYGHDNWLCAK